LGTAIHKVMSDGREEDVKKLFKNVPIFKALVLNSMMSLSKTNFSLTSYLSKDKEFGEFWMNLKDEFELSKHYLLKTANYTEFMEEEQFSKMSINIREKIVLPLLVIQQYALQALQTDSEYRPLYEKLVTRSLYGNINASRNSA
jgi:phosphoenolpyruvate carboxylase